MAEGQMERYKAWDNDEVTAIIEARRGKGTYAMPVSCNAPPAKQGEKGEGGEDQVGGKRTKDEIVRNKSERRKEEEALGFSRHAARHAVFDTQDLHSPTLDRRDESVQLISPLAFILTFFYLIHEGEERCSQNINISNPKPTCINTSSHNPALFVILLACWGGV
jgi:hypothetical protein